MKLISKNLARKHRWPRYFVADRCPLGHAAERLVADDSCTTCNALPAWRRALARFSKS